MLAQLGPEKLLTHAAEHYAVRLAGEADWVRASERRRSEIFNLELREGPAYSLAD